MNGAQQVFQGREGTGAATVLQPSNAAPMYMDFLKRKSDQELALEKERRLAERDVRKMVMGLDYKPVNQRYAQAGLDMRNKALSGVVQKAIEVGGYNEPEVLMQHQDAVGQLDRFNLMAAEYNDAIGMMEKAMNNPTTAANLDPQTYENYKKLTSFAPTPEGLQEAVVFAKENPLLVPKFNPYKVLEPLVMDLYTDRDGLLIKELVDEPKLKYMTEKFMAANPEVIEEGKRRKYWNDEEGFVEFVRNMQPTEETKKLTPPRPRASESNTFVSTGNGYKIGKWNAAPVYNTDGSVGSVKFDYEGGQTTDSPAFTAPDGTWSGFFTGYVDNGEGASPRYTAQFAVETEEYDLRSNKTTKKTVIEELPFDVGDANEAEIAAHLGASPIEATEMWAVTKKPTAKPKAATGSKFTGVPQGGF